MRLEQLVLFGPEDDFRIRFGGQVTVLAGMHPEDRAGLIDTLVQAMAGRLPNASVIYVDHAGRKVFADRTGATYADDGSPAPSLASLLGSDPDVVAGLVTLDATDLGLGSRPDTGALARELAEARESVADLQEERREAAALAIDVKGWRAELAALDARIEHCEEDADRWAWIGLRNELDAVRAELAALDADGDGVDANDTRLLDAVDQLRELGEAWAEAGTRVAELTDRIGTPPDVSDEDLEVVAQTPPALPESFDTRAAAWQRTLDECRRRAADVAEAIAPVPAPDDPVVARLGRLDQTTLWATHARLAAAKAVYDDRLAELAKEVDPEVEAEIEEAHLEVLRLQRIVQRMFLPGSLGTGTLAVGALLAGDQISVLLGIVVLAAAVALGWWLLAMPRRRVAEAAKAEQAALSGADASSWLGLHLRRIDDVVQPADRRSLDAAGDAFGSARLDWAELAGAVEPDEALAARAAIAAHAAALDPVARQEAERHARTDLAIAIEDETAARTLLTADLGGYGLSDEAVLELDPEQLRKVLERRIAAGGFARDNQQLRIEAAKASSAAAKLQGLLGDLGFDDGNLSGRLDRAIDAVTAARRRALSAESTRTREQIEADIAARSAQVEAGRRLSWDVTPDPTSPPADPDVLVARRIELSELIAASKGPDLADLDRRISILSDHVHALEVELAQLADGPAPLHQRITDRVARTTWLGDAEDCLPVLIDEAFGELSPDERREVLDLLERLSARTQVVILSQDPVIAEWSREHAGSSVTLFEADFVAV